MSKWEAPSDFRSERASGKDIREMSRMTKERNACPWCHTVYKTHNGSAKCETWHKILFRTQRADLLKAADKAENDGNYVLAIRLRSQREKIPKG